MHLKSVSAAVALALLSTTAMAADLPSRRAPPVFVPPPPIPVFTWTGFYVGVQAGYEFGTSRSTAFNNINGIVLASGSGNPSGFIGGGHVGYNYELNGFGGGPFGGGLVFGVEGDVDGGTYHGTYGLAPGPFTAGTRENIQGSARGRVGIAVDRALFYATGGAAFGGLTNSYFNPNNGFDSFDHTRVGWTAGAGVEYAITNNWSVRVEYRYTDFGSTTDTLRAAAPAGATSVTRREKDNRVQAGISYKFDTFGPAPVVARY